MHPDWATRDTSSVKGMGGGGAALQPDLVDKIDKSLSSGAPSTGYGLTETHGIVTANSARLYTAKPASCGRVVPTLDAKLIDDTVPTSSPGPDVVGELCVRGSVVIKGYLNRPEATAGGDHRRLVPHRRHRPHRRGRLRVHRRPRQGHGVARRRERLLLRGRGGHLRAPRRGRSGGVRHSRRRLGEDVGSRDRAPSRCLAGPRTGCRRSWPTGSPSSRSRATVWFR